MNGFPWLSIVTFTPLLGGLVILGLGASQSRFARGLALSCTLVVLGLCAGVWSAFDPGVGQLQLIEKHTWVPTLGVDYFVGLDGLSLAMVLLTAVVVPMSLWVTPRDLPRAPLYYGLILLLQSGLVGTFTAMNFFHWFIFWELSLIPAFFLIKGWGGPRRTVAAVQFFLYTMVGSIALLLAFLALFQAAGTFDFMALRQWSQSGRMPAALAEHIGWMGWTGNELAMLVAMGALLGFAVKTPLMPFHTWLPLTYAEAPTPVTMVLTGLMSKMGVYGFLRLVLPIFSAQLQQAALLLLGLAVLTVVGGAAAALAQRDLKRLLAYSSINHLGYCLLGGFAAAMATHAVDPATERAAALDGVILQMFNHGLTAAALFAFVAFLEKRSGGQRDIFGFGGLRQVAPVFAGLMGIALFSSLGLPGLNGFVGEFLVFKGVFALTPAAATLASLGLLLTAIVLLEVLQRLFFGPIEPRWSRFPELTGEERMIVGPAIALMFLLGVFPQVLLGRFNATVVALAERLAF